MPEAASSVTQAPPTSTECESEEVLLGKRNAKNMSDLALVGFEKVKAEAFISERTAYGLPCCARGLEAPTRAL